MSSAASGTSAAEPGDTGPLSKTAYERAISTHADEIVDDLRRLEVAMGITAETVPGTQLYHLSASPEMLRRFPLKVSVLLLTYNQVRFIAQALDSALMQRTDFNFEIVAVDDASTDGTREVLADYAARHPDRIRLILHDSNLGSERESFLHSFRQTNGLYVALLDGDDYWIDRDELQKQVNFLDSHSAYVFCSHNNLMINEWTNTEWNKFDIDEDKDIPIEILIEGNIFHTSSVMYRNGLISEWPEYFRSFEFSDWPLEILLAQQGRVRLLAEVMSAYRIHSGGMWSQKYRVHSAAAGPNAEAWKVIMEFWKVLDRHFQYRYTQYIQRLIIEKSEEASGTESGRDADAAQVGGAVVAD